jgi:hypothetical protein
MDHCKDKLNSTSAFHCRYPKFGEFDMLVWAAVGSFFGRQQKIFRGQIIIPYAVSATLTLLDYGEAQIHNAHSANVPYCHKFRLSRTTISLSTNRK